MNLLPPFFSKLDPARKGTPESPSGTNPLPLGTHPSPLGIGLQPAGIGPFSLGMSFLPRETGPFWRGIGLLPLGIRLFSWAMRPLSLGIGPWWRRMSRFGLKRALLAPDTVQMSHWDAPNTFWDQNFFWDIEPPLPPNTPPPKPKRMTRQKYYPTRIADQVAWLENFRNKLGGYATALGLTAGQVTAAVADARWLVYVQLMWLPAVRSWAQSCTDAVALAQSGEGTAAMTLPVFTPPALPAGVVAVAPGALDRIFALVQTIKDSSGYLETIGTDLQIVGPEKTGPDMATIAPELEVKLMGMHVFIGWDWGGFSAFFDMVELQVDRGDGQGFRLLSHDTTPGYTDTAPLPATPAKWTYRAIYMVNDQPVGVWSTSVSINVGG